MKTWLKGGLIAAGINILIIIIYLFFEFLKYNNWSILATFIIGIMNFPLIIIINYLGLSQSFLGFIILIILGVFMYFLIGTLIGYAIQKIKSRKTNQVSQPSQENPRSQ